MEKFFAATRLLFGWDWFAGVPAHHDGRRRTTKALKMFTGFARSTALANAGLLAINYLAVANAAVPFLPDGAKSWLQSQVCIQSLSGIHKRLVRIAEADN
jgi:hypothetical protein